MTFTLHIEVHMYNYFEDSVNVCVPFSGGILSLDLILSSSSSSDSEASPDITVA